MRLSPVALLLCCILPLGGGILVGCPAETKAPDSTEATDPIPDIEPTPPDPATLAERNATALTVFGELAEAIETQFAQAGSYPQSSMALEQETLGGNVPANPFKAEGNIRSDHSFLGMEPGMYSYTQITLPTGEQAGYVFLGYGDTGDEGPSEEDTDTFFAARNWVEWNKASTDPRLPNDIPALTTFIRFVTVPGRGVAPPADYEAPPQESLVSE